MINRFYRIIDSEQYKFVLIILIIFVLIVAIYYQVISHNFLVWDDDYYVSENKIVKDGISLNGIIWAFKFSDRTYWHPATWLSHMLDVQLFGMNSGMHHVMNVLFHILNSLFLFIFLRNVTGSCWKSAFVAILFAVHPINVDSVAWLAERKNLLSTAFWILALIQYSYYIKKPDLLRYIGLICVFTLGLLSKPMIVTLPFVLLLLDFWPLHRFELKKIKEYQKKWKKEIITYQYHGEKASRLVLEKVPLLILALITIIIASLSIRGGETSIPRWPMVIRIENAIVSYLFYLIKLFWPHNLTFYYPFPDVVPLWQVAGALTFIIVFTFLAIKLIFRAPYLIVGWLWYLGTLIPVLGIIQAGLWPAIAERWAYVPSIGVYLFLVWGLADLVHRFRKVGKLIFLPALTIILALIIISWIQVGYWKNDYTLGTHGIKINPRNSIAHYITGIYYKTHKHYKKSISHLEEALRIQPNDTFIMNDIAQVYLSMGDKVKALDYLSEVMRYDPQNIPAHFMRGMIYAESSDNDKAISDFSLVISKKPNHVVALYNLGILLAKEGENEKARGYLLSASRVKPDNPQIHNALGIVLMNMGKNDEAIVHFQKALNIDPQYVSARSNLSAAMNLKKNDNRKTNDQINLLEGQRKKKPDDPNVLHPLTTLYLSRGEYSKALEVMYYFVKIRPNDPKGYYNIACIYSRMGNIDKSIEWLKKSIYKGFKDWELLKIDKDLDNIRGSMYYKSLISKLDA